MFELVNDIEAYPEYMDGCQSAQVLNKGESWIEARLSLGLGGLTQSFVTRNHLQPPERMTMTLIDGPFHSFSGVWRFEPSARGCKLILELEFSLKNPLLALAVNKMFEQIASSQVRALCARAEQIYGSQN